MEPFHFDYAGYLRNMVFLVILLAILSYILVKLKSRDRAKPVRIPGLSFLNLPVSQQEESQIEVIERKVLEPRKTIYLLRIFDEQYWLVGTTDSGIEALGQVQPPSGSSTLSKGETPFVDYLEDHETHQVD